MSVEAPERPTRTVQPQPEATPPSPPRRAGPGWIAFIILTVVALAASGSALALSLIRPSETTGAASPAAPAAPVSNDAKISSGASPAAGWTARDPALAAAPQATVHNVTLHMQETVLAVAPGVTQKMWTFNGQVPGPILRGHVGDVFNVTVINDSDMDHSIDFHASQTSMDADMKTIKPGGSEVYSFTAAYAGSFMYHCGTAPALEHIGSGMYGAVVIDPPGLAPVDHEYVIVQSELYLGPQAGTPDYRKMLAAAPDAVVFNGYYNQYKFSPISVKAGDRIRIWVIDDGPSDISSFHVVGTIFNTVYKEGSYLLQRGDAGGSQALDLMPAQGGFVELTIPKAGMYAMVSHRFVDANDGALGLIQAS